mgnify:CR=1 FL=1
MELFKTQKLQSLQSYANQKNATEVNQNKKSSNVTCA